MNPLSSGGPAVRKEQNDVALSIPIKVYLYAVPLSGLNESLEALRVIDTLRGDGRGMDHRI